MPNLRWCLPGCFALALCACASQPEQFVPLTDPLPDLKTLNHQATSPDVELLWTCAGSISDKTQFTGVVRNIGNQQVQSVLLQVQSIGIGGDAELKTARALPAIMLYGRDYSPVRVDLPLITNKVRIDLLVLYAITPAVWAPNYTGPPQYMNIEDACSPERNLRTSP